MAELQSLARPYAKAVFELARGGGGLPAWSAVLGTLSATVANPDIAAMLGNPSVSRGDAAQQIIALLGERLDPQAKNFVRLLGENNRMALLPTIAREFEELKAEAESRIEVEITTAAAVDDAQAKSLIQAISKRLARDVEVQWKTDPSLIAGAVIRAGDLVIDGSVAENLNQLRQSLSA